MRAIYAILGDATPAVVCLALALLISTSIAFVIDRVRNR